RLGARSKGPERWLGVYFLAASLLGTVFSCILYMGWVDPSLALPAVWLSPLQALHIVSNGAGLFRILMFTSRPLPPHSPRPRPPGVALAAPLLVTFAKIGFTDRFAPPVLPGPSYWINFAARVSGVVWMSVESFRYGAMLRRRLRLGLADPLVANRFLLWGA